MFTLFVSQKRNNKKFTNYSMKVHDFPLGTYACQKQTIHLFLHMPLFLTAVKWLSVCLSVKN